MDVGCGDGSWVRAFEKAGVRDVVGVDGPWSPFDRAVPFDFATGEVPFRPALPRSHFDAITCLEFAEHIPATRADELLGWMTTKTTTIIWSAATPAQGGTGHINEQWPSYWTKKFERLGFVACDLIRPLIWARSDIAPWYRQNILCYFKSSVPGHVGAACNEAWRRVAADPLPLAHPEIYTRDIAWRLREAVRSAVRRVKLFQ